MAISEVRPAAPRPAPKKPQVSRRSFLRTAWLAGLGAAAAGFGVGTVYFLWPNLTEGFGTKIQAGTPDTINADIKAGDGQAYNPGRFYLVPYNEADDKEGIYAGVAGGGFMALYQRCVHLGCRVPGAPPRSGGSAPATAPSTTRPASGRKARPRAASTASPSRCRAARSWSTPPR